MEQRTINGIPVKEVFEKLKEDIPGVIMMTNEDKPKPYLEVSVLRQYFDRQIPPENYDFQMTDLQFISFRSRACFICIGTLTVYDDNGNKVITKSFTGSSNCIVGQSSGEAIDLAMDVKNAAVKARKGCIQLFGCGERQLARAKAENKKPYSNAGRRNQDSYRKPAQSPAAAVPVGTPSMEEKSSKSSSNSAGSADHPPVGKGRFLLAMDAGKKSIDTSTMVLIPVVCMEYKNYKTKLLIWKNRYKNLDDMLNRIMTGIGFYCDGKLEPYNNEYRIVLDKIVGDK